MDSKYIKSDSWTSVTGLPQQHENKVNTQAVKRGVDYGGMLYYNRGVWHVAVYKTKLFARLFPLLRNSLSSISPIQRK